MTGQVPQEIAAFRWEEPTPSTAEAGKKILSGVVTIGNRKFNVTVGYNEETLKQAYNMPDANPDEFIQTIQAIIENIRAEDIIQLSGSKITTSEQPAGAKVLHNGREYTLPALTDDPSEKLRRLGETAQRVVHAFSASGVFNLRSRFQTPTPPPSIDINFESVEEDEISSSETPLPARAPLLPPPPPPRMPLPPKEKEDAEPSDESVDFDDDEEESSDEDVEDNTPAFTPRRESESPPAPPSTRPLESEFQRQLAEAEKKGQAYPALLNAYKSLCQIRKVATPEVYLALEKQFKTTVFEQMNFTASEESTRDDFSHKDSNGPFFLWESTALTIAQKEILQGLADPKRLANPVSDMVLENICKRKPAISQQLADLLQLRRELLELSVAEGIGRQAITEYMKNYKILEGIGKDIAAGRFVIEGDDEQATKNRTAYQARTTELGRYQDTLRSVRDQLQPHLKKQEGSVQNASMKKIFTVLNEMIENRGRAGEIAGSWALDEKDPFTLAVDLGGAYSPAFGDIPYLTQPDIAQIQLAHRNLAAKDPKNKHQFEELDRLLVELTAELNRVQPIFAPYYKKDKAEEVGPMIRDEADLLREKVADLQRRLNTIEFKFTDPGSYTSIEGIRASDMNTDLMEYGLVGNVSKTAIARNLEKILRHLNTLTS